MLTQRMRVGKKQRQGSGRFIDCFQFWAFVCCFFFGTMYISIFTNAQEGLYLMFWKVLASMKTSLQDRRECHRLTHKQNRSKQNRN